MPVIEISKTSFKQEVLDYKGEVVVDFYGSTCPPCKMIAPILEAISETTKIKIVKIVDTDNISIFKDFNVSSVPSLLKFKNGIVESRLIGAHPKSKLETFINT